MTKFDRSRKERFVSCPGSPLHEVKHGEVQDDGTIRLIVDRIEDTDKIIHSYAASTDIHNIMARIQAGDISLLNQKQGFYGDVVGMPKTYAEMLELINRGQEFFMRLPAEIKEQYNNDFNQFFADFDNALKKLTPQKAEEAKDIVEEVKTEE